ncbi:CocE/NonD family hydrolase [Thiohalomonas denitrificans]|uniref:CocE/NonD family hydrolase n=1 Tax=Thiohalomonas denitrificans TaxID=415747 RepID=UPI0026EF3874|nr:CocE/NonD family hydrolase [Thiohalomonas denitrificans]
MRSVRDFPHKVRTIETAWIAMADGVHLAARIWLPEGAERQPVPAILEYIPYRHRDNTRSRDQRMHPYFAGHGYAAVRVDIRGSGNSEGTLEDEYLESELQDGAAIIRWLAEQPWCDGNVGMIGISWGGFNGLQIAARRPPALKAIVSVCSTDDRYADDVHHMGGCLLGDNLSWASTMFGLNSLPPDPQVVEGDRWRELWHQRLRGSGLWLEKWLRHQRRDDYWKHGSICEDWNAVQCPVMAVSGWADGYTNAVFRLLEHLQVPRLGLVGPWSHKYPHEGIPGPGIGFLQECLRWWDFWLKGRDTGIMDEPMLRAWMQESVPPTTRYRHRPGRWVAEESWPSPAARWKEYFLAPGRLAAGEGERRRTGAVQTLQSPLSVGFFAGKWCSYSAAPDLPHDQREEDGGALIYESAPLEAPLELLGAPEAELVLAADRPVAMVAVRLSDVAPDDKATRVAYGLLNLTHRDSSEHPQALEPGERYRVRVKLNDMAQVFPRDHRLRLSLSTSYWPLAWPPPEPVRLTLYTAESRLRIPVRPPAERDRAVRFEAPEGARPLAKAVIETGEHHWRVIRDLGSDYSTLEVVNDDGMVRFRKLGLEMQRKAVEWYSYQNDDFCSPRGETVWHWRFHRDDWDVRTVTRTTLTSDPSHFHIHAQLDAYEGKKRVYSDNWDLAIKRDLV